MGTYKNFLKKLGRKTEMGNIVIVGANQGIGYYMAQRLLELENSVAGEQNLI